MEHISAEKPVSPMLILHGDKDRIVPLRQSVLLYEHLKRCGKKVEFYKMRGADHGTAGLWSEEVYSLMDAFIKRHLRVYRTWLFRRRLSPCPYHQCGSAGFTAGIGTRKGWLYQ